MDEAFEKWKMYPRFSLSNTSSTESRSRIEIYKRVFEENESIFYDLCRDDLRNNRSYPYNSSNRNINSNPGDLLMEFFLNKYGE